MLRQRVKTNRQANKNTDPITNKAEYFKITWTTSKLCEETIGYMQKVKEEVNFI